MAFLHASQGARGYSPHLRPTSAITKDGRPDVHPRYLKNQLEGPGVFFCNFATATLVAVPQHTRVVALRGDVTYVLLKANSIWCSQAVTHPSTNQTQRCLNFANRTRSGAFNVVWPLLLSTPGASQHGPLPSSPLQTPLQLVRPVGQQLRRPSRIVP